MANVFDDYAKLVSDKSSILPVWQEIGEYIYPALQDFNRYISRGEKRGRPIFDQTAELSNDTFASSLMGLIANPSTKWLNYQLSDTRLMQDRSVQMFLDEAQTKALSVFNNPRGKFYDNLFTLLKIIGAFGTGALMMDDDKDAVAKFRAESPKNIDFTEDFGGNVKDVYFEREYTVEAILEKRDNDKWTIPSAYNTKPKSEKVKVLRHIRRNNAYDPTKAGIKFAKFISEYWLKEEKQLAHSGFFNVQRVAIGRWDRMESSKWADSPGRVALGTTKMINAADRAMIVAMEKELSPTLFVSSEAKYGKLDTSAGAVNVGRGNPNDMLRELKTTGNIGAAFEWMETKRQQIRNAFYVDVFQMNPSVDITATQAMIMNQEKMRGIAPKGGKIQSDVLGPAAEFVLYELIKRGEIKLPEILKQSKADIKVIYLSPLAQAQRLQDANSILQFMSDINFVAQASPTVLDRIDFDATVQEMADIRGIPEKLLLPLQETMEIRDQRNKERQAQQMMASTQQIAETAKTMTMQ